MICPACKTETGSDSQFCPHCGANMTTGVAASTAAQQSGLSETAAGVVAYITIIPAIIFLVMDPYNRRVALALLILWIFVMIKASKGERYKIPFIGNFAEQAAR